MNKYLIALILILVGCVLPGCTSYQDVPVQNGSRASRPSKKAAGSAASKNDVVSESVPAGRRMLPEDFSSSLRSGATIVYFAKISCPACEQQNKIWKRVKKKLPKGVKAEKRFTYAVNYRAYGVRQLPTIIVYKNGNEVRRFIGVTKENKLISAARGAM